MRVLITKVENSSKSSADTRVWWKVLLISLSLPQMLLEMPLPTSLILKLAVVWTACSTASKLPFIDLKMQVIFTTTALFLNATAQLARSNTQKKNGLQGKIFIFTILLNSNFWPIKYSPKRYSSIWYPSLNSGA